MSTKALGHMGEESAALYLMNHGYKILGRNVYIGHDEIDIIARNDTHLVFAEVKTRRARPGVNDRYGRPADAVNRQKQACLMRAARQYLRDHAGEHAGVKCHEDTSFRWDGTQGLCPCNLTKGSALGSRLKPF